MPDQPFTLLYDASGQPVTTAFAPVTSRPAQALYSSQGGLVSLGSDYAATPKAQVPKIDANGSAYSISVNPAGGSLLVGTGQASGAASTQYGNAMYGRMDLPTPSVWNPVSLDMVGSLNTHLKSKMTFRTTGNGITCAANKALFSIMNTGSMVIRISEISIYVPVSGNSGNLLGLGSGTTYYPLICELRRTLTYTGGTSLTPISADSADTLSAGVTLAAAPATVSASMGTFHRADAIVTNQTGQPWFWRWDPNEKTYLVRPGEGATIVCISSGTINNASGSGTTTAAVDIEMTFTQAVA